MTKVLIVYGSRHGATRGIAQRIGEALMADGLDAEVVAAAHLSGIPDADAYVVGSGIYIGSWLKEPVEFLERNVAVLATRPLWLFSSGPLRGSTAEQGGDDPVTQALGPTDGPGSGGRKKIEHLAAETHARAHQVFFGAFDPADPPRAVSERLVRMMPASKGILPAGDFREWDAIDAWAHEIAAALTSSDVRV